MGHPLYDLLRDLESASIHFTLGRYRYDTIRVTLTLVGERVEVDVFDDGHMEVSRFPGDEAVVGEKALLDQIIADQISADAEGEEWIKQVIADQTVDDPR